MMVHLLVITHQQLHTLDVEIHASSGTITGGVIRVYAACVIMDDISQSGSAAEVDRDLLA